MYYSDIRSSIFLPSILFSDNSETSNILKSPEIKAHLNISKDMDLEPEAMVSSLRKKFGNDLKEISDIDLKKGVELAWGIIEENNCEKDSW